MKSWLLWMVVCQFGRKCARLEGRLISIVDGRGREVPPPAGFRLRLSYACEGCGRTKTVSLGPGLPEGKPE